MKIKVLLRPIKNIKVSMTNKSMLEIVYKEQQDFPKTTFYKVNNQEDIKALEQKCNIKFIFDKKNSPPVFIASVAVLPVNTFGVYASETLGMQHKNKQSEVTLGRYLGKRIPKSKINKNKNYHYGFQTLITGESEDEHDYEMLDGQHIRNWAVFVNHSPVINVQCEVKKFRGKRDIFLTYRKKIKKNHQLLISYGSGYFIHKKHKQLYLHETDNWETPAQKFKHHIHEYLPSPQKLSAAYITAFGFSNEDYFVMPKIIDAILHHDKYKALALIKKRIFVETLIYRLKKKSANSHHCYFIETSKQQQISSLMAACYVGDAQIIKALLKKGADVTRFSLNDGNGCLHFLLLGQASDVTKLKIGQLLIKKGAPLTVKNQIGKSILDLCFEFNLEKLAISVLESKEQSDILYFLFEGNSYKKSPCAISQAIERGWFKLLKMMIEEAEVDDISNYLKTDTSFLKTIQCHQHFAAVYKAILMFLDKDLDKELIQKWLRALKKRQKHDKTNDAKIEKIILILKKNPGYSRVI